MMSWGEALYRAISDRSPVTERWSTGSVALVAARLVAQAGSVSGAARALGVARSTLRGWLAGSKPKGPAESALRKFAHRAERRDRLKPGRERRIRAARTITVEGEDRYSRHRKWTWTIPHDLKPSTMDDLVQAFLQGDSLRETLARNHIDRQYREMIRSTDVSWGIDVHRLTIS